MMDQLGIIVGTVAGILLCGGLAFASSRARQNHAFAIRLADWSTGLLIVGVLLWLSGNL